MYASGVRYLHIKNERRDFMTDSTDFKGMLGDIKKHASQ